MKGKANCEQKLHSYKELLIEKKLELQVFAEKYWETQISDVEDVKH